MRLSLLAAVLCMSAIAAHASPITYSVTETAGTYSATGTVTTDGTIGILTRYDIDAFAFEVSTPTTTDYFSYAQGSSNPQNGSLALGGADLVASPSALTFNYSGTDDGQLFFIDEVSGNFLCLIDGNNPCYSGVSGNVEIVANQSGFGETETGIQIVGTALPLNATPEPSSLALLGTGLLGGVGVIRRRPPTS